MVDAEPEKAHKKLPIIIFLKCFCLNALIIIRKPEKPMQKNNRSNIGGNKSCSKRLEIGPESTTKNIIDKLTIKLFEPSGISRNEITLPIKQSNIKDITRCAFRK